jgi:hypothetical protein
VIRRETNEELKDRVIQLLLDDQPREIKLLAKELRLDIMQMVRFQNLLNQIESEAQVIGKTVDGQMKYEIA